MPTSTYVFGSIYPVSQSSGFQDWLACGIQWPGLAIDIHLHLGKRRRYCDPDAHMTFTFTMRFPRRHSTYRWQARRAGNDIPGVCAADLSTTEESSPAHPAS